MKNKNNQPIKTRQDLYDAIGDYMYEINVNAAIAFSAFMIIILLLIIIYKFFLLKQPL